MPQPRQQRTQILKSVPQVTLMDGTGRDGRMDPCPPVWLLSRLSASTHVRTHACLCADKFGNERTGADAVDRQAEVPDGGRRGNARSGTALHVTSWHGLPDDAPGGSSVDSLAGHPWQHAA